MDKLFKITIVLLLSIIIYLLIRLESIPTPTETDFKVIDSGGKPTLIDMKSGRVYFYDLGSWLSISKKASDSLTIEPTKSGIFVRENNPFQK